MEKKHKLIYGLSVAIVILLADQISKWWVVREFEHSHSVKSITSYLNLVLTHNHGISFGLLASDSLTTRLILIAVTVSISCLLIWWLTTTRTRIGIVSLGAIIGGAFGNITDRITVGAVIDFIDFHVFDFHWPAFNVADSAICIGAAMTILESFFTQNNSPS